MSDTLIIQSHQVPLPYPWIERCLESVRSWSAINDFEYHFMGDELFDYVPDILLGKLKNQRIVATDIARLLSLQQALNNGYERVVWLDADFLIFDPLNFILPDLPYSLGREVWVQREKSGDLKVYKKIHNAFLMFRNDNNFLEFYSETCQRLLMLNVGNVPPQFIGPKLLTALHNVAILPVMETAGMLSPMVIKDMINDGGVALDLFVEYSPQAIKAANLCISSCKNNEVTNRDMDQLIDKLLSCGEI